MKLKLFESMLSCGFQVECILYMKTSSIPAAGIKRKHILIKMYSMNLEFLFFFVRTKENTLLKKYTELEKDRSTTALFVHRYHDE